MYYEVFIPSVDPNGYDTTITVDAENWMSALKSGLERTGEGADSVRNVMCDIKSDNTIHVTDATTRRVFVLREISEQDFMRAQGMAEVSEWDTFENAFDSAQQKAASAGGAQQASASADVDETLVQSWTSQDGRMRIGSSSYDALRRDEGAAKVVRETRQRTTEVPTVSRNEQIGRAEEKVSETLIEDVFLEIQDIHEGSMDMEQVVNFVMDMAVNKVNAESGAILFVDINGQELYFATARGPKAKDVMSFRVPMGQGIVGFCAREGVSLAISDADRDPRFYKRISQALGYPTKSLLCAPIQHEGRVYGAVELINKNRVSHFSSSEMAVLTYIGRQLGQYVNDVIMRREKIS